MIIVNETFKEKITRYVLIFMFICITIIALIYRQEKLAIRESSHPPHAIVLHNSIDENDNPVVLLYEHKNNQHTLGIYEIEKQNRYKFNSRNIVNLNYAVEQLSLDENENGFWANSNGKWQYFDMSLQKVKRDSDTLSNRNPYKVPFTFNKEGAAIKFNDTQSISLNNGEVPQELHKLSEDGLSWLVLTDTGVKIATVKVE